MKKLLITITLASMVCFCIQAKRPPKQKPHRVENTRIVLGNLAQIIGQIGNIIENPHNADNVGDSVSNMVDSFIKITVNAVQKRSISTMQVYEIIEELEELCKDYDNITDLLLITKKKIAIPS